MAIVSLQELTFFRRDKAILQNVSLAIEKGRFVGLIGPNGTGKSTMLRMLANLLRPQSGAIYIEEKRLTSMSDLQVAQAITYMPQSTIVDYQFTVEQIVLMGRNPYVKRWQLHAKEDKVIVEQAMRQTGVYHLKNRYVNTLSGGERQLVFLARSIAQQSAVMLLDEPTSDLDIYHQVQICQIIKTLTDQGKTVIAAIHDINLAARYCDELLLLREGNVVAFADTEKVLTEDYLRRVFATATHVYRDPFFDKLQIIPYDIMEEKQ